MGYLPIQDVDRELNSDYIILPIHSVETLPCLAVDITSLRPGNAAQRRGQRKFEMATQKPGGRTVLFNETSIYELLVRPSASAGTEGEPAFVSSDLMLTPSGDRHRRIEQAKGTLRQIEDVKCFSLASFRRNV